MNSSGDVRDRLFARGNVSQAIEYRKGQVVAAIARLDPEQLLNTPIVELCGWLEERFRLDTPTLDRTRASLEQPQEHEAAKHATSSVKLSARKQQTIVRLLIPFEGSPDLFHVHAGWYPSRLPRGLVREKVLQIETIGKDFGEQQLRAAFDDGLREVERHLTALKAKTDDFNAMLPTFALAEIKAQRDRIVTQRLLLAQTGFPIRAPDLVGLERKHEAKIMPSRLTGVQIQALVDAIGNAYSKRSLQQMLRFRLDKDLENISLAEDKVAIVFDLVDKAEKEGWWPRLVVAARASNPENPGLIEIEAALLSEGAVPTGGNLEKIVDLRSQFGDVNTFGRRFGRLEACVCAVEDSGGGLGTGWLVAADLVITNYHVVRRFIEAAGSPLDLVCRFDFKIIDGTTNEGSLVPLATNWRVAHRPYGPSDLIVGGKHWEPHELDYALLRLAKRVGEQPIGEKAEAVAPRRGWITLPSNPPAIAANDRLWLFQHPQDESGQSARRLQPMKITTGKVLGFPGGGMRMRHDATTLRGSSGSPCCNWELLPVALHHAGDPRDWSDYRGEFNQAIPLERIVKDLKEQGIEPFWDKAAAEAIEP